MIYVLKKRFGFATNSSSVHSIVWFAEPHDLQDRTTARGEGPDSRYYGWGEWVAASLEAKRTYWATQFKQDLGHFLQTSIPEMYYWILTEQLTGIEPGDSIDHQSCVRFPRRYGTDELDVEFYNHYVKAFDHEGVVLVGGNDNEKRALQHSGWELSWILPDRDVDLSAKHKKEAGDYGKKSRYFVSRVDDEQNQWVLFNQFTGEKTRISFKRLQADMEAKEHFPSAATAFAAPSGFPELVDLKITDYCDRGCVWCYQGSGQKGRHADDADIHHIVATLRSAGTLEIALGGGEPTQHPRFASILKTIRDHDIVPNFSTGTLAWLTDDTIVKAVKLNVGGWAYTVRSIRDLDEFIEKVAGQETWRTDPTTGWMGENPYQPVVSIHLVMGTVTRQDFRAIMERCAAYNITTTLLGYKRQGRGKGRKPIPYGWWVEDIEAMRTRGFSWNVSVDTSLVQQTKSLGVMNPTAKAGGSQRTDLVDPIYFDHHEAIRSMYIDAVELKTAPCSYSGVQSKNKYLVPYRDEWRWKQYRVWRERNQIDDLFEDEKYRQYAAASDAARLNHKTKSTEELLRRFRRYRDAALQKK